MTWCLTALSLCGVLLNIRRDRRCFACWLVSNSSWAIVDFAAGIPAQGALMAVYAGLSVWGWMAWGRRT